MCPITVDFLQNGASTALKAKDPLMMDPNTGKLTLTGYKGVMS